MPTHASTPTTAPADVLPQWPIRRAEVPDGPNWIHEVEHVGQRLLVHIDGGAVRLMSASTGSAAQTPMLVDWTDRLPTLARAVASLPRERRLDGAVIDGVLCALDSAGRSSLARLDQALMTGGESNLLLFAFDLLFADGVDLRGAPLLDRKRWLRDRVGPSSPGPLVPRSSGSRRLWASDYVLGAGAKVYERACELGVEGVVSKRIDSIYEGRLSDTWVAVTCGRRTSFVIGGFTSPQGSRRHLGSLLVGTVDPTGRLIYRGKVGSGFDDETLAQLRVDLETLRQDQTPFFDPPLGSQTRGVTWVRPVEVVEVEYGELSHKGRLRFARFKARTAPPGDAPTQAHADSRGLGMFALSEPDRPVVPMGTRRRDLADYITRVARFMLPHLERRPLSILTSPTSSRLVTVEDELGLLELFELDGVEIQSLATRTHPLPSRASLEPSGSRAELDHPDRLVFTLACTDQFDQLSETALELRARLAEFGLTGFVKTAGLGVGLDIVVPLQRRCAYPLIARFCQRFLARMLPTAAGPAARAIHRSVRAPNGPRAMLAAPYSPRLPAPNRGPGSIELLVSTPIPWDQLARGLRPEQLDIHAVSDRLREPDPWADYFEVRQWITKAALRRLEDEARTSSRSSDVPGVPRWSSVRHSVCSRP